MSVSITPDITPDLTPNVTPAIALLGAAVTGPKPSRVEDAARQFESILLAQMLKSGREAAADIGGEDENEAESSTMLEVAEQQFAQMLTGQGGIGLARLVQAGLERGGSED